MAASSRATTRKSASFLSLRNRFLVWAPGISPRSAWLSSTVKSGGCVDGRRGNAEGARGSRPQIFRCRGHDGSARVKRRACVVGGGGRLKLCRIAVAIGGRTSDISRCRPDGMSGCSSGVEHNLAKVGVEGSNPFARSKFPMYYQQLARQGPFPGNPKLFVGVHMVATNERFQCRVPMID